METYRNQTVASSRPGSDPVRREVVLPAPPDRVWAALSESKELAVWFGADVQIDPRPTGRALFRWPDGTERPAVVEEAEPERRLSFRWLAFVRDAGGEAVPAPAGRVEFELEEVAEGTRLCVTEWTSWPGAGRSPALRMAEPAGILR
jgi:uncharacterized protein YndB with AHSA1/START domain